MLFVFVKIIKQIHFLKFMENEYKPANSFQLCYSLFFYIDLSLFHFYFLCFLLENKGQWISVFNSI